MTSKNCQEKRMTSSTRKYTFSSKIALYAIFFGLFINFCDGARLARAVKMDMENSYNCTSGTITERNKATSIILTGTVKKCDKTHLGNYSCRVQVWRIIKGREIAGDLIEVFEDTNSMPTFKKSYVNIHGFGNRWLCDSRVKEDKTKIFFLNRVDDGLVLAASLLHITLKNLENTEKVVKGIEIEELPKKKEDPCLFVLCGFGAKCSASQNGTTTCVCPTVTCGKEPGSSDVLAPVCGSDGVTYPSECRLKAAQCWHQRRIRIISKQPCSPVQQTNPCKGVICGNQAKCMVEEGIGKCQCLSCAGAMTKPVCGSDQKTYRTECDLRRRACMTARALQVIRRSTCDPCEMYNEETKKFEPLCEGECSLDENNKPQCCDAIACEGSADMMLCGSNGRTYISKCALERFNCRTGKNVTQVSIGSCPSPRETTVIRGSTSIAADNKCPGGCDNSSPDFITFKEGFEKDVNKLLRQKNKADIDAKELTDFKIEEVRKGSAVLVYSAQITWRDMPIEEDFFLGVDTMWAFQRLHDPARGVLKEVTIAAGVTFVAYKNAADDFIVEEVCGTDQCSHGEGCQVSNDELGGFEFACVCSSLVIGNPDRLPVTLGCKLANNNRFYDNRIAVKEASCATHTFFTFRDICQDPIGNLCDDIKCTGDGTTCIITNRKVSCECITCNEEFEPVCGSNEKTYKSVCELQRENCLQGTSIIVESQGMCASQCDEVDCRNGQCEEISRGNAFCTCPSNCIEVYSPVCGSDGETYDNECEMTISACKREMDIIVVSRMPCNGTVTIIEGDKGSGEEPGSGECGCKFGASCDMSTIDDEDVECICDIKCHGMGSSVCGSDGITYTNACELSKAQCEKQKQITITSYEKCPDLCSKSTFGCCEDGVTAAKGSRKAGCPETCQCNEYGSFSPFCNYTTGQCVCRPGVGGLKCNQCQIGFWNFRGIAEKKNIGCMDCRCEMYGSMRDDCDQMTGQCICKKGISGVKCSKCDSGGLVSPEGCVQTFNIKTASSCEELTCHFGQECVAAREGLYICQCPPLSSCDIYSDGEVCASNGITFADKCQMNVVACRQSKILTVVAEGTCKDYMATLGPVIPPLVTISSTMTTTTASAPTTTSSTTISTTPTFSSTVSTTFSTASTTATTKATESTTLTIAVSAPDDQEGSAEMGTSETTIDDERNDTDDMDFSGDDDSVLPTGLVRPDGLVTPESTRQYTLKLELSIPSDISEALFNLGSRDSEMFAEYSENVKRKITDIMSKYPKQGVLSGSSINDIVILKSENNKGIMITQIELPESLDRARIEEFINSNLGEAESITIVESVAKPIEPPITYDEGGEWSVPQFGGASYLEYETMSAYSAATIHMRFKSTDSEGLLLYNGQSEGRDFISLSIIGGFVEFRFDTGSGQLSLRSNVLVNDGEWHNVVSRRNRREGMLMVDDEQEIGGTSPSRTTGVNLDTSLFIGGFSTTLQDRIMKQTGVSKGLTGCISEVKVGEHGQKDLELSSKRKTSTSEFRVAECANSPCIPNPCQYASKCFITYQLEEFTYKCDCGSEHYGEKCQYKTTTDTCASSPCHESATCVEDENSYRCICPEARTGIHCNTLIPDLPLPLTMEPSYMPMFAGDSYIERPALAGVSTRLDVEVVFYTFQLEGLIFYNGQRKDGKGDFVALNLRNGYLEFIFDLGEGPVIIRSQKQVTRNEWHTAKLSRLMKIGDLTLDDGRLVKGESPHRHSQLNLEQPLFIGSHPDISSLPRKAEITTGLMGAIQKFVVNDVVLPRSLAGENTTSFHVKAFNGHHCYRQPCLNEGACVPDMGDFLCVCKPGFSGRTCQEVDETEEVTMLQDTLQHAVYFDGKVKALYNNYLTRKVHSFKRNHFELQLRTTALHGLIFYDGKSSRRGDYIALSLNYGRLHLTFDLGSGPANIMSDFTVNDGMWKTVKIIRNDHRASLQIDDMKPKLVSIPQHATWLNTDGMLWIGGCDTEYMPPRHRGLSKSFYVGFEGCIRKFRIDGNLLRLRDDVLNQPGLATCPNR